MRVGKQDPWYRSLAVEKVRELRREGWSYRDIGRSWGWTQRRESAARSNGTDEMAGSFGLTPAQARVARLAAEGLSNKAIASRLDVSHHTIRRHIEGVLAKLGVPDRRAIARRLRSRTKT